MSVHGEAMADGTERTLPTQARLAELIARRGELGRAILYAKDHATDKLDVSKRRHLYDLLDRAIRRRAAEAENDELV